MRLMYQLLDGGEKICNALEASDRPHENQRYHEAVLRDWNDRLAV